MGKQQIGGTMMEQVGTFSKMVKNLQDMEKITPEPITLQMGNMQRKKINYRERDIPMECTM